MADSTGKINIERREARCVALLVLFEADLTPHEPLDVLERYLDDESRKPKVRRYAAELVTGVIADIEAIDERIGAAAPKFAISDIAAVDRNVLRIALFELRPDSRIPYKVAINEAIEVAKDFGGESSGRFVNGVLGTIASERPPAGDQAG